MIGTIIEGAKTKRDVERRLKKAGLQWEDLSADYGYMNLRVPILGGGYYRIYRNKRRKRIEIQKWGPPIELTYSGIPTFEPSGRHSF